MEALGDVDEAIDFLNYYARENCHAPEQALSRGSYAVISPWNFPLAIPCGMVSAPLVAGNTVILKSAEQTPLVAARLVDLFHRGGVPEDVLVHLPGEGESVGAALVDHERLAGIVFTGSREVGIRIVESAAKRIYQNRLHGDAYPVRVIAEMGGKNAIVVADNAELDETVAGILTSAFGHAGQKCSAASRVVVRDTIKSRLIERLSAAMEDLTVAQSSDFNCQVNPLINRETRDRLLRQIGEASLEAREHGGRVLVDRSREKFPGWCLGPVLIELPAERGAHPDSYARRELFGPVLHVMGADSLDEALGIANATEYALTGGIFSQSQDDIDGVAMGMESGNIYVNRNITGARVAVEPFGGFKFSGTGPKAGHPSYLRAFYRNGGERIVEGNYVEGRGDGSSPGHFDLCSPPRGRRGDLDRALESMGNGIAAGFREQLSRALSRRRDNLGIPGQISYDDWNLGGLSVLLVSASGEGGSSAGLLQVAAAMAMGAGVSLACLNGDAHRRWPSVAEGFHRAGWERSSIDAFLTSERELRNHFANPRLSVVILEGPLGLVQSMLPLIHSRTATGGLKRVLTSIDTPADPASPAEWDSLLEQFVHLRSFAVNTVRYGAPFELVRE